MRKLKRNLLLQILRSILITIFDLPGTPFLDLPINLVLNFQLKLGLGFPTYVTPGSIIILTANGLVAVVGSMTKLQLISSYAVRCSLMNGLHSLARFQT